MRSKVRLELPDDLVAFCDRQRRMPAAAATAPQQHISRASAAASAGVNVEALSLPHSLAARQHRSRPLPLLAGLSADNHGSKLTMVIMVV